MKQRLITSLSGSVLALGLLIAPVAGFASGPDRGQSHDRGFFSGVAAWFGARIAHADTNLAPSISGVRAPTVLAVGAEGTWTVNASDPENGSLSYSVDWGDSAPGMLRLAASDAFVQTSTFTHTYEKKGVYTARFTVKDDGGRTSSSSVTVRVGADENSSDLTLSSVAGKAIDQNTALISWETNLRSDSTVFYSDSTPVSTSTATVVAKSARVLRHQVRIDHLAPGTTYHFLVQSKSAGGSSALSSEASFTTPISENGAPVLESIDGPKALDTDAEGTWTVNASDPENGSLSYSVDWGDANVMARMLALVAPKPAFTQTSTFSHTYAVPGTYTITVTVKDDSGLSAEGTATVVVSDPDTDAPTLSGLTALVGRDRISFSWNTDVAADSEVHYSASSPVVIGGDDTTVVSDDDAVTSHSLDVGGLEASTAYHFIIRSKDADDRTSDTSEFSLTTMSL